VCEQHNVHEEEMRFDDLAKMTQNIERVRREEHRYIIEFPRFCSFRKYYILGV
jgi:hypothetical protein